MALSKAIERTRREKGSFDGYAFGDRGNKLKFMNAQEAAEYLGVSKSQIYKLTSERRIPHYKPTMGKVYFRKEELDEFIENSRVGTRTEIKERAKMMTAEY